METLRALILANQLFAVLLLTGGLTVLIAWICWEKLGYFIMRVWHGLPLIGTVARMGSKNPIVQADGWTNVEMDLCRAYLPKYNEVNKSPTYFNQCLDYLNKVRESGRRPRPVWVYILIAVLLVIEAIGFGYVLSAWLNMDASANERLWMAAFIAILLAIASCILAEIAGHAIHKNSLVKKALAWWQGDNPDTRVDTLKEITALNIDQSFSDDKSKDYQQILGRITTSNEVLPQYASIYACLGFIIFVAIGAFIVRSATLESIEAEMINQFRAEQAQENDSSASPFELPQESQDVNSAADEDTIDAKMAAIRKASLVTYVILSVIYLAIQGISIWLASIFGFQGNKSREAWTYTHRFNTADEMSQWMTGERIKIAGHADHKLNMLQQKLATKHTTNGKLLENLKGSNVHKRDFLAFVSNMKNRTAEHDYQIDSDAVARNARASTAPEPAPAPEVVKEQFVEKVSPVESSIEIEAQGTEKLVVAEIDARTYHNLTEMADDKLMTFSKAMKVDLDTLKDVREQQVLLKEIGVLA